jgi:CheY-like chemotaxis protein
VLLVEDNEELGRVTEQVLGAANYRVTRVLNADQAVRDLERNGWDVVLSDVRMPGTRDGLGLAEWILQHRPGVPVVLMTGYSEQMTRARSLGVPVIPKPMPPEILLAELQKALSTRPSSEPLTS